MIPAADAKSERSVRRPILRDTVGQQDLMMEMDSIACLIRQLALHELHARQRNFAHALRSLTSPSALPHLTGLLSPKVRGIQAALPGHGHRGLVKEPPLGDGQWRVIPVGEPFSSLQPQGLGNT